jgi:hypothetical protein
MTWGMYSYRKLNIFYTILFVQKKISICNCNLPEIVKRDLSISFLSRGYQGLFPWGKAARA